MFKTMKNAWRIPDIRKKLIYTLFIIVVFRIGSAIAVPFLDADVIREWMGTNSTGSILEYLNLLSGGNLSKAAIFSMSVQPFINASIIMQLLSYALPPLERLSQEGEEGRKKINQITSILAVALGFVMSTGYYFMLKIQWVQLDILKELRRICSSSNYILLCCRFITDSMVR